MSEMRKPEISVVRFTESDVIVASNGYFTVSGAGDSVGYNLRITDPYNKTIYLNTNSGRPVDEMSDYGGSATPFYYSGTTNSVDLRTLTGNDSHVPGNPYYGVDGNYLWSDGAFRKQ